VCIASFVYCESGCRPANTTPAMPSIFSKLGGSSKRNNPYSNPHHPGHAPLPTKPSAQSSSQPNPPLRSVFPRTSHDYLAEARQVANRDPVTGRPLPHPVIPQSSSDASQQPANTAERSRANAELSAYLSRASRTPPTTGTRYDLFSSEERKRIEREEQIRIARGGVEFYAPERRVEEFYANGVRD
jgi:hypothetical protein